MTAVRVTLSSADDPLRRAENILRLLGLTIGDPDVVAHTKSVLGDVLKQYAELDAEVRRGDIPWPDKSRLMAGR